MNTPNDTLALSNQKNLITNGLSTLHDLRQAALGQLDHIQKQEKTIIQVRSNLDLLMQRYNVEKGLFSRTAEWYGSQAWWLKILFGLIVIGIAIGIGALCHMPIALGCTAAGLYLFAAFLFINHYTATEKRNKRLCEDVLEMEHSLNDAVTHFAALTDSLKKVMLSLCQLNCQMTEHIEILASQHQHLSEKVVNYQTMVNTLNANKTHLTEEIDKITQKLKEANHILQTTQELTRAQSNKLLQTTKNIESTHSHLVQDEERLRKETEALHALTDLIARCYDAFQPIFATLNQIATMPSHEQPPLDSAQTEFDRTHQVPDLTHLEVICSKAETLIKHSQQQKMVSDNQSIEHLHTHTETVIQRTQALLQKRVISPVTAGLD